MLSHLIRYLAVEALLGHWDGASYNKNNFYLYENPVNGLVELIPYDTDNTYGINWIGDKDWATRDILDWPKHGEKRPLAKRILANSSYYRTYVDELNKLLDTYFSEDTLFSQFDDFKSRLNNAVSRDTYFSLTNGFTLQTFIDSYDVNDLAGHLPYGLKPYVRTRTLTANENLSTVLGLGEELAHYTIYPNPSNGEYLTIYSATLINLKDAVVVNLHG